MSYSIRAVCFDVHGTLVLPEPSIGSQYADSAIKLGISSESELNSQVLEEHFFAAFAETKREWIVPYGADEQDAQLFWGEVIQRTFTSAGLTSTNELATQLYNRFAQAHSWRVLPNAKTAWKCVQQADVPIAVVSNFDSRARQIITGHGFDGVACWAISAELGIAKPDPRILHFVCDALKVEPQEVLHIGDKPNEDGDAAQAAGCTYLPVDPQKGIDLDQLVKLLNR